MMIEHVISSRPQQHIIGLPLGNRQRFEQALASYSGPDKDKALLCVVEVDKAGRSSVHYSLVVNGEERRTFTDLLTAVTRYNLA